MHLKSKTRHHRDILHNDLNHSWVHLHRHHHTEVFSITLIVRKGCRRLWNCFHCKRQEMLIVLNIHAIGMDVAYKICLPKCYALLNVTQSFRDFDHPI